MAKRLLARGHSVTMVCGSAQMGKTGLTGEVRRGLRRGLVDGIDVIEIVLPYSNHDGLFKRALIFLRFAFRSVRIAFFEKYDLLFATSTPLTASIPGIAMRLLKPWKPFVFEVRDLWPELPKEMGVITNPVILWAMGVLEWLSYRTARGCIGLSPGIRKGILRRSQKGKRVALIPNGCDLARFQPGERGDSRRTCLRAVFTGAHGMANGLDAVLDAALELKARDRMDIEFHFIGDGKLKPGLVQRAQSQGLSQCQFHDAIPKTQLQARLGEYDLGLMILANIPAFYYGTSPNKFFDYISAGMPVLNNYPGWLAEMVEENECGYAVPPDDPAAFADAMERLADDPEGRVQMGNRSRILAEEKFDRTALADQFVDFLEAFGE